MSTGEKPRIERKGTTWLIHVPGEDAPFEVLAWNRPHLLLGRGDETRSFTVVVERDGAWIGCRGSVQFQPRSSRRRAAGAATSASGHDDLSSPMPGKVLEILVKEGDTVSAGDRLVIVEAMKMENPLRAPHDSVVARIHVAVGDSVTPGDTIIELDEVAIERDEVSA